MSSDKSRGKAPAPPSSGDLHEAALRHLARYTATQAGLRRLLMRRVDRWARLQTDRDSVASVVVAAQEAIDAVIRRLLEAGVLNDIAFAESRAKTLVRGGQSNRSVQARLIAKGVAPEVARTASASDADTELAAALVLVRKRRIGAYRVAPDADAAVRMKEMGMLARAGFTRDVAQQALEASWEDAERRILELRR